MLRDLRKDLSWLWVGYLARTAAFLGITAVLSRALGPSGYGELAIFLGLTLGVSQLAGSWPFLSLPILHARGHSLAAVLRPSLTVAAACTGVALLVVIPAAILLESDAGLLLWAVVVYSIALVAMQAIYGLYQAVGRMAGIAVTQALERGVTLILLLVAGAFLTLDLHDAEALMALSAAAVLVGTAAVANRKLDFLGLRDGERPVPARTILGAVGAMGIVSACSYGVAWMDVFMLSAFVPSAEVGVYALAYQILTFVFQIGSLWAAATLPRHARMSASGRELNHQLEERALATGTLAWAGLMSLGAALCVVLVPEVFGADFDDAIAPLALLLAAAGLAAAYYAITPALIAGGRTVFLAKVSVAGAGVNFALNLILIPGLGPMGAAIATATQTVGVTVAVLVATVGPAGTWRVLRAGLPAALALVLLAVRPDLAPAAALAAVVGTVSFAAGARGLLRYRVTPT